MAVIATKDSANRLEIVSKIWDFERAKNMFDGGTLKVGDYVKSTDEETYQVSDISIEILDKVEENKLGIDFTQASMAGPHNIIVYIIVDHV